MLKTVFKLTARHKDDLVVHLDFRGMGLGWRLMNSIIEHLRLQEVEHFDLNWF